METRFNLITAFVIFFAMSFTACMPNEEADQMVEKANNAQIALSLYVPSSQLPGNSRAITNEFAMNNVTLFAFSNNGGFLYKKDLGSVVAVGNQIQRLFVQLPLSETAVKIVVVANTNTSDLNPRIGASEEEVFVTLNVNCANPNNMDAIPMWGEYTFPNIKAGLTGSFHMLRSLAKIEIDATYTGSQFKLESATIYNTNNATQVIPIKGNWNATDKIVTAPSIPSGAVAVANGIALNMAAQNKAANYVAETNNGANQVSIVISGNYSNEGTTWYRLDMITSSGATLSSLLRNHKYLFQLMNVKRSGYATKAEAINAQDADNKTRIEGNVMIIDEDALMDITTDGGDHYLAVNNSNLKIQKSEGEGNFRFAKLKVFTTNNAGWYIANTDLPAGVTVSCTEGEGNKVQTIWIYVTGNVQANGSLYIQSGNIRKEIKFAE